MYSYFMRPLRKVRGSSMPNFKFVASQEVFDASIKEAKTTFLIPARKTLINLSSLII